MFNCAPVCLQQGSFLAETWRSSKSCMCVRVTTVRHFRRMLMKQTASKYGQHLRLHWICSRGQLTRGSPQAWGDDDIASRCRKKTPCYETSHRTSTLELRYKEHPDLYSSSNVIMKVKSSRIRWAGDVVRGKEIRRGYGGKVWRTETI